MPRAVNTKNRRPSLRVQQAEGTRRRIVEAATVLFLKRGYSSTTIEAIAAHAGVAVETVYSRFQNKANILAGILEVGIANSDDGRDIFDQPEIIQIRSNTDQRMQLQLLAAFSRGILERTDIAHRILQTAAAADRNAAELQRRDRERRCESQRVYIDMLLANGPLREGLTPSDAADAYSVFANPGTYAFLIHDRGWTPDEFQQWLADTLMRVLL
jgi:AcrR family transcriptional regulator